jgi:hypothetical protein
MLRKHETRVLARDLPEFGLKAADVGTVVLVHLRAGCEVELITPGGKTTLVVVPVSMDQLRPIRTRETAHARQIDQIQRGSSLSGC